MSTKGGVGRFNAFEAPSTSKTKRNRSKKVKKSQSPKIHRKSLNLQEVETNTSTNSQSVESDQSSQQETSETINTNEVHLEPPDPAPPPTSTQEDWNIIRNIRNNMESECICPYSKHCGLIIPSDTKHRKHKEHVDFHLAQAWGDDKDKKELLSTQSFEHFLETSG